ncbi:cytochrome P450 [Epithele typhae]|uniref:cytochrome P450 n=1 Tax=Epithele typhae TaxID=378194 RepID=UPI00200868AC|nr:cytochrome P450 [Epithele typhae]KAH9919186.1 cytochrome P450 [Epithele typhae]
MPELTPGLRYLLRQVPNLAVPPATVFGISHLAHRLFDSSISLWLLVPAYVLSWPVAFALRVQCADLANLWAARTSGTLMPPTIASKYPGGLDVVQGIFRNDKSAYLAQTLWEFSEKFGFTYNFRVMFEDRIFTSEPEYIKLILATDFQQYEKGPLLNGQLGTLLGVGVFNADGDMWKFHRSMTRPFFSKDRITHFDIFDRHAEHALNRLAKRMEQGIPVDWQDLVSRFTMDSATEFLFGRDCRSLEAPLPLPSTFLARPSLPDNVHPADRFVRAFQKALEATAHRGRYQQAWPLAEMKEDSVQKHLKAVDEFIDPIVDAAVRKQAAMGGASAAAREKEIRDDETLLEHLVKYTDDRKVIKDETLNILLAGRDTTSCALTFAVYALAEHPDILARLRAEVLQVVGPVRRPTYDDVRELKYMRAFTNEVLRLYPPVPINTRCTINSMHYYIPPRSRVMYSVFLMHRRTDLWGPDALKFDPDRFLDERLQKYLLPNPFIFLPFNAGPRICLGQQFAYNEIAFMLVRLLQRFAKITLRQDAHPAAMPPPAVERSPHAVGGRERVWLRSHLTAYAKNGVWVEMEGAEV